ncbi:ribonucleotide-diphosphate reductase beta subunit [Erythrobacter sp. NAP1]|nr:ribonucleotide-diphosphate reductase beta subunit [Erythrobacter sp. NAP1]
MIETGSFMTRRGPTLGWAAFCVVGTLGLSACAPEPENEFGRSAAGHVVIAHEEFCTLRVAGSPSDMTVLAAREGDFVRVSFDASPIAPPENSEHSGYFGFRFSLSDGRDEALGEGTIRFLDDGNGPVFMSAAPGWVARELALIEEVRFVWDDVTVSTVTAPAGLSEEAAILSACIGRPLDSFAASSQ